MGPPSGDGGEVFRAKGVSGEQLKLQWGRRPGTAERVIDNLRKVQGQFQLQWGRRPGTAES